MNSQTNSKTRLLPELHKTSFGENSGLQLSPITVNEDYRKKWNIHEKDFACLTNNGELIRNTLYRIGGMGANLKADYFLLLKHTEGIYSDEITTDKHLKYHLQSQWCIIDKNGIEKVEFKPFRNPYMVTDSQIYSVDRNYYNIETGEFYCDASSCMVSDQYLFLDNRFDKDKSKRGVMKINKKDGTWELFPTLK